MSFKSWPRYVHAIIAKMMAGIAEWMTKTIVARAAFDRELRRVRIIGHAIDDEEFIPGVRCIAAPVFSYTEEVVAALGAIGPRQHMTQQKMRECGALLQRCARELSRRLGMPRD